MTTKHPVDSTTCPVCKAIGSHAPDCMSALAHPARPCGSVVAHGPHGYIPDGDAGIRRCPGHEVDKLRPVYGCPDWCVREDHDAEHVGPGYPPMHYAEPIGAVNPQSDGFKDEVIVYLGEADGAFVSDPAELRRVAADMIRGAEWLEARA